MQRDGNSAAGASRSTAANAMEHPKHILSRHNIDPKKSLGQNFLHDDALLSDIVVAASVDSGDAVLEIGAGLGALTRRLAQVAGRVVALELDQRLLPILKEQVSPFPNVEVVHADVLAHDPRTWFEGLYKVAANVPYYITGAILEHLLGGQAKPQAMALTVQKEVAQRITAEPGDMTLLAVSVQFYGRAQIARHISAGAFWPRPEVDSSILRFALDPAAALSPSEESRFFRVVRTGFSQKRKQLQKNLRALGLKRHETVSLLESTGIDPRRRAETLSIQEWLKLYEALRRYRQDDAG